MTGAEYLREGLLKKGLRQKDLAEKLHVSESAVQKWCTGKNAIPANMLPGIACILDISPFLLMGVDMNADDEYRDSSLPYYVVNPDVLRELSHTNLPILSENSLMDCIRFMDLRRLLETDDELNDDERADLEYEMKLIVADNVGMPGFEDNLQFFCKKYESGELFKKLHQRVNLFEHLLELTCCNLQDNCEGFMNQYGVWGHPRMYVADVNGEVIESPLSDMINHMKEGGVYYKMEKRFNDREDV